MVIDGTPVEDYTQQYGLLVKREDLCCPLGPHFSKCRGVYAHVKSRPESVIGVLDTVHSQGGFAVARACQLLGKKCVEFYPVKKSDPGWFGGVQRECKKLGALTVPLAAGRSAILFHRAKADLANLFGSDSYIMPNALKLPEMITETVAEVHRTEVPDIDTVLISASSGTIAAGVIKGLWTHPTWQKRNHHTIVHLGYSRPEGALLAYMEKMSGMVFDTPKVTVIDEKYGYADKARPGIRPPFPCNEFYDLKAFRWWLKEGRQQYTEALFWNIG